ncbi:hypothetical protein B0H10DRAFT_1954165 [Mycena sp. CBHHK59/15]|nr:hypothetical protein B0H10DRAFT_1954165 [Mycena sp. CBHHK59/15]
MAPCRSHQWIWDTTLWAVALWNTYAPCSSASSQFRDWVKYNMFWMAECLHHSLENRTLTEWDFGAIIGLSKVEFLCHITAPTMDNIIHYRMDKTFNFYALDLEIVFLIRPWYTHIRVIEGPT